MRGAGGTQGGIGQFLIGVIMMIAGGYLFLQSIVVSNAFSLSRSLYNWGGVQITGGLVLVPFIFGIGFIFYNSRNILGWILTLSSLVMLSFGIISGIQFRLQTMSAFELLTIITLFVGGIGLFLNSLRNQ